MEIEETVANIEKLVGKENDVFEEFKEFLGDNHKWGDFLLKVYRKRIKRKIKPASTGFFINQLSARVFIIVKFFCLRTLEY